MPGSAITVSDINEDMLGVGKQRAIDGKLMEPQGPVSIEWDWVTANAEELPFEDASFDSVTIAFGIRNVTRIDKCLTEAHRVLKPGGRFLCLEFGPNVENPVLRQVYDTYSFNAIPLIGGKHTRHSKMTQPIFQIAR